MQPENENTEAKFDKDSIGNVFITALSVCLVCSFLVAGAAVSLKSWQDANKKRDIMTNIVRVAGIEDRDIDEVGSIEAFFKEPAEGDAKDRLYIKDILIDLETGESAVETARQFLGLDESVDEKEVIASYDQYKAANDNRKDKDGKFIYAKRLDKSNDIAGLAKIERISHVYLLQDAEGNVKKYIFPVRGKGLWSVLYGFLSVEPDFQTISGLTYYTHGETPGLGGEVDNPAWKKQWTIKENRKGEMVGKQIFGDDGEVKISVVKGKAQDDFSVDGLAGATITSNGVTNMLEFWFGSNGFKAYIEKQQQTGSSGDTASKAGSEGVVDNG